MINNRKRNKQKNLRVNSEHIKKSVKTPLPYNLSLAPSKTNMRKIFNVQNKRNLSAPKFDVGMFLVNLHCSPTTIYEQNNKSIIKKSLENKIRNQLKKEENIRYFGSNLNNN